MAYDPATSQLVLFGGAQYAQWQDDTWIYETGRQIPVDHLHKYPAVAHPLHRGERPDLHRHRHRDIRAARDAVGRFLLHLRLCHLRWHVSYGSGAGTCTIDAGPAGKHTYLPAAQVTQRFTVSPALLSITASCSTAATT